MTHAVYPNIIFPVSFTMGCVLVVEQAVSERFVSPLKNRYAQGKYVPIATEIMGIYLTGLSGAGFALHYISPDDGGSSLLFSTNEDFKQLCLICGKVGLESILKSPLIAACPAYFLFRSLFAN